MHIQLEKVVAPDVARIDGTLRMFNMSIIHNSKSVRGRWLLLFVFRRTTLPWRVERVRSVNYPHHVCMSSKPMHLVRTMQNAATKLP